MKPLLLFTTICVAGFGLSYMSPWAALAITFITIIFPVFLSWICLRPIPRTKQLLFWVVTLCGLFFATGAGMFLALKSPGGSWPQALLCGWLGWYIWRLQNAINAAQSPNTRFFAMSLTPADPPSSTKDKNTG